MACVHLTWGGYLCFATSFSSCAHIPKLEKCLVRPLGDHTHDFGGGLEFSYIIVLMVLYGPCCKSDSGHHYLILFTITFIWNCCILFKMRKKSKMKNHFLITLRF